jgi:hypothetical protein
MTKFRFTPRPAPVPADAVMMQPLTSSDQLGAPLAGISRGPLWLDFYQDRFHIIEGFVPMRDRGSD